MQVVEHDLLHLLVHLLLLPQDDIPLALNRRGLESRVLENVADVVNAGADVLGEALGVVHGLLARRVRVQVRAKALDGQLELMLGAALRALERHVLQEVRGAVRRVRLRPRPRVNPHTHRRRLRVGVRLRRYRKAIRKRRRLQLGVGDVDCSRERP